ncbi:hypothetical protein R1sor_012237 [Riccia sorocarpa]|uniref:Uncharacterized protein n=1 Tax=Riccia sorocarpa TaxID=122646 RepID=A0ABD3I4G5_9MARC
MEARGPGLVSLGILLKTISNTTKVLEVLAMKDGGGFVRLMLDPKFLERQISKTALGPGLLSAERSQVPHDPPAARVDTDSEEEREIARDVKASQKHEAQRMAAAKAKFSKEKGSQSKVSCDKDSQSSKDKGKTVVQEAPKKKPSVPTQVPREKLLGSSMAAETARLSRESKTDSNKRKRETQVTPPPPPNAPVEEYSESDQGGSGDSDKDNVEVSDTGSDSPPPSQPGLQSLKLL